jgi:hypothetical protein
VASIIGLPESSWCDKNAVSFQLSGVARDGGIGRHAWHSKYRPEQHNFQKDVPSIEVGAGVINSNFVDLRSGIAGGTADRRAGQLGIDQEEAGRMRLHRSSPRPPIGITA